MFFRRLIALAAVAVTLGGTATAVQATTSTRSTCVPRLLVLGAMPIEVGPLLAVERQQHVLTYEGRDFYSGQLAGNNVLIAMTHIGIVNATKTTQIAFRHYACISGVVFSGTSGGLGNIGDVATPQRWTLDAKTYYATNPTMYAAAVSATRRIHLERQVPLGDPACACYDPSLIQTISMPNQPVMHNGGSGLTMDPFGGRQMTCAPHGGDVFGCEPCKDQTAHAAGDVAPFLATATPFIDPTFFTDYFQQKTPAGRWAAQDMETAAVAKVASQHGVPFIGFRAQSDGNGDPLHLPGFPFQFFVYRQIAADNAAKAALTFLAAWATR